MTGLLLRVVVLLGVLCSTEVVQAATYMLIPNISGETTETNHVGWVELQSLNWGHSETPPGSPTRVQFNKVNCVKQIDSVTPALALLAANGQQMRDVKVEVVRQTSGTAIVTFRLKLTNVRLAAYAASVQANQTGTETFALEYDSISWISFKTNNTGVAVPGTAGCWDVASNKSCTPSF